MPSPSTNLGLSESEVPDVFEAFEDSAAYVNGSESRSRAMTLTRDVSWRLCDYPRADLRVIRVYMCPVEGDEADEFFGGEFERGWIEVTPTNAAQRSKLIRMWKVEPR